MPAPHVIQKMILDIDWDSFHHDEYHQKDLVEWVKQTLLTRLESVLDEMFLGSPQVYVERLSLDLANCKYQNFKEEAPRRFEMELRSALIPHLNACKAVAKKVDLHPHAIFCKDILASICIPLLPKGNEERVREIINQVTRIYCEGSTTVDVFDLSKRIIFELANAYPILEPRQFATIAYPRLKSAISVKGTEHTKIVSPLNQGESIENAGLVIAAPYLGHLFRMLELIENGKFKDDSSAQHAMHVLQYVVYGDLHSETKSGLLNAVLCGYSHDEIMENGGAISEEEKLLVDQMLSSIIQHWRVLGSTTVQGLRDTFLRHSGWLKKEKNSWDLKVHSGPFDVLVDRLPWGISMVKYDWMPEVLKVNWRVVN